MKLSAKEKRRRSLQAKRNFGLIRKTRGVRTMARRKKYRQSKSQNFLGIQTNDIWKGVGAGSAGLLGGGLSMLFPQIAGNIAQGVAGLGLSMYGTGIMKQMGKGAVIKTIGDLIEDNVVPMLGLGLGNSNGNGAEEQY